MKISKPGLCILLALVWAGCSKSPTVSENPEEELNLSPCIEFSRQLHKGVEFNLGTGEVDIYTIGGFDNFYEAFVIEANLIAINSKLILVSSEHGNYLLNLSTGAATPIPNAESPISGKFGVSRLYFDQTEKGQFVIEGSQALADFPLHSYLVSTSVSLNQVDTLAVFSSERFHTDSLAVTSVYFPTEVENGIISLLEESVYFVERDSSTNTIEPQKEYRRQRWAQLNDVGEIISEFSNEVIRNSSEKPVRFSFSANPLTFSHQEGRDVYFTDSRNGKRISLEKARSPKVSSNGDFVSFTDFDLIEIYAPSSDQRFQISNNSDYIYYNPSEFLPDENAIIYAEKTFETNSKTSMVLKKATITNEGLTDTQTIFNLTDHIEINDFDFVGTRTSQPSMLAEGIVFFMLIQHQLRLCE